MIHIKYYTDDVLMDGARFCPGLGGGHFIILFFFGNRRGQVGHSESDATLSENSSISGVSTTGIDGSLSPPIWDLVLLYECTSAYN